MRIAKILSQFFIHRNSLIPSILTVSEAHYLFYLLTNYCDLNIVCMFICASNIHPCTCMFTICKRMSNKLVFCFNSHSLIKAIIMISTLINSTKVTNDKWLMMQLFWAHRKIPPKWSQKFWVSYFSHIVFFSFIYILQNLKSCKIHT